MSPSVRTSVATFVVVTFVACSSPTPPPTERTDDPGTPPPAALESPDVPTSDPSAPPPPEPGGLGSTDPDGIGGACVGEHACVLVRPPCGDVGSAPRARAAELQDRYDEIASVAECAASRPVVPVEPVCMNTGCSVHPRSHPGVLVCSADRDCVPFEWGCHWTTVARSRETDARRLMPIGPACPGILPVQPEVRCTFGFCSLAMDAIPR